MLSVTIIFTFLIIIIIIMVGKIAFLHESCRVMEDAWNYTVKSLFHATNHGMTQDVYIYLHVDCERLIRAM